MYNKKPLYLKYTIHIYTWIYAHPILLIFLLGLIFSIYNALSSENVYLWQWYRVWHYIGTWTSTGFKPGILLQGVATTIHIALLSFFLAIFIGLITAILKLSVWPIGRLMAFMYIESIRSTPLLIQLFIMYFLFAPILNIQPFYSAVLSLSLFEGAYIAEIFRSGLLAVPSSQWEAAYSMGLNSFTTVRVIILPQALPHIIPTLTGQIVSLIKDTSLVSAIAVTELTMNAQQIITTTFLPFEVWSLVGIIYLILALTISIPAYYIEKKYKQKLYA